MNCNLCSLWNGGSCTFSFNSYFHFWLSWSNNYRFRFRLLTFLILSLIHWLSKLSIFWQIYWFKVVNLGNFSFLDACLFNSSTLLSCGKLLRITQLSWSLRLEKWLLSCIHVSFSWGLFCVLKSSKMFKLSEICSKIFCCFFVNLIFIFFIFLCLNHLNLLKQFVLKLS